MAPSPISPPTCTTRPRRVCSQRRNPPPTSRSPKAAIIPAPSASFRNLRGKFRSRRFESVVAEASDSSLGRAGNHPHRPGHHLLRRRPRHQRRPRRCCSNAWRKSKASVAALPLRLSQPHHRQAARNHREARQHLQVPRRPAPARLARRPQAHEARRRRRHLPQDASRKCAPPSPASRCARRSSSASPARPQTDFEVLEQFIDEREVRLARRLQLLRRRRLQGPRARLQSSPSAPSSPASAAS